MNIQADYLKLQQENKRLKEKLEEKNSNNYSNYSLLFNSSPLGICTAEPNGRLLDVNASWLTIFGSHSKEETLKINILKFQPLIDSGFTKKFLDVCSNGKQIQFEQTYTTQWQKTVTLYFTLFPSKNKNNDIFILAEDITEKNVIKEKLILSELRWKFGVDGSELGLWDWDIPANVVFFSAKWKTMLGYNENDIANISEEWDSRIHPDDKRQVYIDVNKHIDKKTASYKNEHRLLCKDGSYKWVLSRGIIVSRTKDNKPKRMIGTHSDISKQKKTEADLLKLNATKDKLFSIISHDLNGPFKALLALSSNLSSNYNQIENDIIEDLLKSIHITILNTSELVETLLEWSISQKENINIKIQKLSLYLLVEETIKLLLQAIQKKTITIKNQVPENFSLKADKDIISTVIRNLLSNAIKFTPEKGLVTISARQMKTISNEAFKEIKIKDTGVGIDHERQVKIFDISGNSSTFGTEGEKGSGLGLSLCKEFINNHKGKIWVESELNKGSSFYFRIPV